MTAETESDLAVQAGIIDAEQAETLARERSNADAAGQFFSSLTFYRGTGRKPRK
jgi:hypothetical protein